MMFISVSLNLLFLTLFIRSFSEFKNNKFVLEKAGCENIVINFKFYDKIRI